jgi:hypothetical protein
MRIGLQSRSNKGLAGKVAQTKGLEVLIVKEHIKGIGARFQE